MSIAITRSVRFMSSPTWMRRSSSARSRKLISFGVHRTIQARIGEIDHRRSASAGAPESHWRQKVSMGAGPLLLLALTKGKFLLLGLTKMGTLLTMLASLGVYWAMYGWAFALGLVV